MQKAVLFLLVIILSSCNRERNINNVEKLERLDKQITIRHWNLLGPIPIPAKSKLNPSAYYSLFKSVMASKRFSVNNYIQQKDYADLNEAFHVKGANCGFVYCQLNSSCEQNVALLTGVDNNATFWLNGQPVLVAASKNITKNEFVVAVHLRKGINQLVGGIISNENAWNFHLGLSNIAYARRYAFGLNNFSFSEHYFVKSRAPVLLALPHPDLYENNQYSSIEFTDVTKRKIYSHRYYGQKSWTFNQLPDGIYKCRLVYGKDTLRQFFFVGDYKKQVIANDLPQKKYLTKDAITLQTLKSRFKYLDSFGIRNGFDSGLERKMTAIAYDIFQIEKSLTSSTNMVDTAGFHIRSFRSKIDGVVNHYAYYYPENFHSGKKMSLVIIMPWVAKQNPFTESWHLAFTDHIEYLESLARKYGFALMWQSARVYEQYNLGPMVSTTALEALADIKERFNVDTSRTFLYGTCSGGLQALLFANRYPSKFAAIGVEGPEISYLKYQDQPTSQLKDWTENNSIINTATNFAHVPIYLANSINDWHGAKQPELNKFLKGVRSEGGTLTFDSIDNATRDFYVKMVNDNVVTDRIFHFFKNKSVKQPMKFTFSTYQLKYNHAYNVTINDFIDNGKATISYNCISANRLLINTINVASFSLNLDQMDIPQQNPFRLFVNGRQIAMKNLNGKLLVYPPNRDRLNPRKTSAIEGPINHFFAAPFVIVTNKKDMNDFRMFSEDWNSGYFGYCRHISESNLTWTDIKNYNMVLYGNKYSNRLVQKMLQALPVTTNATFIKIGKKVLSGSDQNYALIFPNPYSKHKYLLLMGTNSNQKLQYNFGSLSLRGFNDIEVWKENPFRPVFSGNFDRNWAENDY